MLRFLIPVVVTVAALTMAPAQAQAQSHFYGHRVHHGGFHHTPVYHGGHHSGFRGASIRIGGIGITAARPIARAVPLQRSYSPGYRSYSYYSRRPVYHDTTHLDYHPTSIRRHGNHYDYTPGHYDVHRTGHYHH